MTSATSTNATSSVLERDLFDYTYKVLELYPNALNVYGDTGNSLALVSRMRNYGLKAELISYNIGDTFLDLSDIDIIIGHGGADKAQASITADLLSHTDEIKQAVESGTPTLVICGMYQLFGNYYETHTGERFDGLGIFDIYTVGKKARLIGNVISQSRKFGTLIGYENHSGQTFLSDFAGNSSNGTSDGGTSGDAGDSGRTSHLLAENITLGVGNNTSEPGEGYLKYNTIGTYLHGPFLPKNPQVTDWLIYKAVSRHTGLNVTLNSLKNAQVDQVSVAARSAVLDGGR